MSLAEAAWQLAQAFGQAATLRKTKPGTYDPATGTDTPAVVRDVDLPFVRVVSAGVREVRGTLVTVETPQAYIPARDLDPEDAPDADDTLLVGVTAFAIRKVRTKTERGEPFEFVCDLGT